MILASMWIWAAGGSLITPDGKRVLFDQPKVHKGLVEYFGLYRHAPTNRLVTLKEIQDLFIERRAAAMMGSIPVINTIANADPSGDLKKRLGIALPPGPVFVGGSNLIVWQHSYKVRDAIDFIRFLSRADVQTEFARQNNDLPSRIDALSDPFYADNPHLSVFVKALGHGRTFPVVPLGGMVQDMFTETLSQVWKDIVAEPSKYDLETMVAQRFDPLARRLNQRLAN
jgi:ABC-type glycerol-3-phosphate transport system substrate-binding protein